MTLLLIFSSLSKSFVTIVPSFNPNLSQAYNSDFNSLSFVFYMLNRNKLVLQKLFLYYLELKNQLSNKGLKIVCICGAQHLS